MSIGGGLTGARNTPKSGDTKSGQRGVLGSIVKLREVNRLWSDCYSSLLGRIGSTSVITLLLGAKEALGESGDEADFDQQANDGFCCCCDRNRVIQRDTTREETAPME